MPTLNSTAIHRVEYDPNSGNLEVWFHKSGDPYTYFRVPAAVYQGLLNANSHGRYFDTYIRNIYGVRR